MSRRMVSLWIVGALLVATTLKADSPQGESTEKQQIRFDVKVWDVDHAKLRLITKSESGLFAFYRANGLAKLPEGFAVQPPELDLSISPLTAPVRAFAVRPNSVSRTLHGHDISSAFKAVAEPTLITNDGKEATLLSGGEVPVFVPQSGDSKEVAFHEFGVKLKILPRLMDKGRIALGLDFENSELDRKSENGESGVRLISSQGFRLSAQMKLGEQLLVAQQIGKPDVTRLVQIQPMLHTDQPVAEKPNVRPATSADSNDVEKTVLFQVRVYEVDHSGWTKEQGVEKRKQALDEILRPWIGSSRGSKLEKVNVKAWTVKELAPADEIEKLGSAVRLVSEPKLAVVEGNTGSFDYGGKTPQLRLIELKNGGTSEGNSQVRPLATTFALEPDVTDAGRVLLNVYFNPHGELRKKRSSNDDLKKHGVKAAAELSVGQTLCLSDARPESSDHEDSLLVTITPYEIATREVEKRIPSVAAAPAKTNVTEITVEDRWPTADIKVGQRVVAVPVTIEKTSLQADLTAMVFAFEPKSSQRVTRIEPLPNQAGRRVTISVPFNQHEEANDRLRTIVENYLDAARTSTSTFVIPASTVSQADLWNGRPVQEIYEHIPIERRPRPVELTVGESFTAIGVAGLITQSQTEAHHEFGPLNLSLVDKDAGGVWRASATKTGMTRLIQFAIGSDLIGPARLTEYLVKADTRELELHIRQQFPSARVAITSVGSSAVMLKGTVAADEDVTGIVELAEQFAPKVLNRLKVGAAIDSRTLTTSATEPRAVQQASAIADDADSKSSGERGGELPRVIPASATSPEKADQLRELLDEIRELRREVRSLSERLEREASKSVTSQKSDDEAPNEFDKLVAEFNALMSQQRFSKAEDIAMRANELSPGHETVRVMLLRSRFAQQNWQDNPAGHFEKLVKQFDQLMHDKRFAEAEVVAKQAKEICLGEPAELMLMKAQHARLLHAQKQNERKQEAPTLSVQSPVMPPTKGTHIGVPLWGPTPLAHESVIENAWQMLGLRFTPLTEPERKRLPQKFQGGMKVTEVRSDSPASQNKIRQDDILVGLHIWEITNFDNLQYVLGHPHVIQHGTLKFFVIRDSDTMYGELKIVKPAMPMPSAMRMDPAKSASRLGRDDLEFNTLILEFNELMQQNRFAEAEVVAKKALELDPDNPVSQTLLFKAQLSRRTAANEKRPPTAGTSTRPLSLETPFSNAIPITPPQQPPAAVGFTENDIRIVQQLGTQVELDAIDLPLSKVVEQLARKADINIVLDKAGLEEAGIADKEPITCTFSGIALRSALKLVLEPLKLSYVIDGEVLKITSRERAAGPLVVVAYPMADSLHDNEKVSTELEHLVELIRSNVAPDTWDKAGGQGSIIPQAATKLLLVRQTNAVHDELHGFLNLLRKTANAANTKHGPAGLSHLSDEEIRITQQLQKSVSLELEQATLKEAVEKLATMADFNVVLDQAGLEEEGLTNKTPVSLRLKEVRLATAMRLLLEPLNLTFVVKNEVMVITSRPRAEGQLVVATYSVPDLLRDGESVNTELERLGELIQSMIEPNTWSDVGGAANIKANPSTQSLVVRQTSANQTRIRELLETMRSVGKRPTTKDK